MVYFFGCEEGENCTSIMFSAGFDTKNGLDLSVANDWNAKKRYARASLDDERDPNIEFDIAMHGGMPADLFNQNLTLWDLLLSDFTKHIDW